MECFKAKIKNNYKVSHDLSGGIETVCESHVGLIM